MATWLVLGTVAPVFALILAGWIAGRVGVLPGDALPSLNAYVVWLALPALLFQALAEADWRSLDQPGFLFAFSGGAVLTFLLSGLIVGRGRSLAQRSLAGLAGGYANTAFLGIPLASAVLGEVGRQAGVLASIVTVCALFAAAVALIEFDRNRGRSPALTLGRTAGAVLRNPLAASPLAGAAWALAGLPVPAPAHRFLALLGASASPCALVTLGLFLARQPRDGGTGAGVGVPVLLLSGLKLLVQPAITAALLLAVAAPRPWAKAAILIAALPTGTGPFMAAQLYGEDVREVARTVLATTVLSVATATLLILWLA